MGVSHGDSRQFERRSNPIAEIGLSEAYFGNYQGIDRKYMVVFRIEQTPVTMAGFRQIALP